MPTPTCLTWDQDLMGTVTLRLKDENSETIDSTTVEFATVEEYEDERKWIEAETDMLARYGLFALPVVNF